MHVLLGRKKLQEFDAQGISKCILSMLAEFCTPFLHVDWFRDGKHQEAMDSAACPIQNLDGTAHQNGTACLDLDKNLLKHVLEIVEVFNADAAADEQLAGQLLESDPCEIVDAATFGARRGDGVMEAMEVATASFKQVFPNLTVINKDKPLGARRIVSRTFKCDPVLNKLVDKVFMSSDSIVQQIHFSDVVRHAYAQNVRAMQFITPLWKQMSQKFSAAKHCFDTWNMPFAKVCLTLEAVIRTAQTMHEERKMKRLATQVGHSLTCFLKRPWC